MKPTPLLPSILLRLWWILLTLAFHLPANGQEAKWFPLGPIGGNYSVAGGTSTALIRSLDAGGPGITAGLQTGDYIYGAFDRKFSPTGAWHFGVSQELGFAVDRAEGGDGNLPLLVLRPGVGPLTINVALGAPGAFGVAYPRNSSKFAGAYENAVAHLHSVAMSSNGDRKYLTGWTGLSLLGHPNWNDTAGSKPYRLSINKIRDFVIGRINYGRYAPVEDRLIDGASNPNYTNNNLSNWELGQMVMFLSEYYAKTGDASVSVALQRGAEMCANTVQWWKQPGGAWQPEYSRTAGMSSHSGVGGDYMQHYYFCGLNITGVHNINGMAFARRSGMNMGVRPKDGHYFGYNLNPGDPIPAPIANALPSQITLPKYAEDPTYGLTINNPFYYDPSVNQKFLMQLNFLVRRSMSASGSIGYAPEATDNWDAGGRTPGALLALAMYNQDVGGLDGDDLNRFELLKNYITIQYMKQQEAHAFCVGAQAFQALCAPYLSDRQQRYFMDNWRFTFALSRTVDNAFLYYPARTVKDNYLSLTDCAAINLALPYAIANGNYVLVPGYNVNRTLANFKSPFLMWPSIAAKTATVTTSSYDFQVDICDGNGNVLNPSAYTASWSYVSGPDTATFSSADM